MQERLFTGGCEEESWEEEDIKGYEEEQEKMNERGRGNVNSGRAQERRREEEVVEERKMKEDQALLPLSSSQSVALKEDGRKEVLENSKIRPVRPDHPRPSFQPASALKGKRWRRMKRRNRRRKRRRLWRISGEEERREVETRTSSNSTL